MQTYDWSKFVKRINIHAPVETIYNAWATRSGIESWFVRFSEYADVNSILRANDEAVEKGDTYTWRWHGWPDEMTETGEILHANEKDLFEFTFSGGGQTDMKVVIHITTEQNESIVELTQYNIPEDEKGKTTFYIGCGEGWVFYLANLKSILEGGIDLRNKNLDIKKVINS